MRRERKFTEARTLFDKNIQGFLQGGGADFSTRGTLKKGENPRNELQQSYHQNGGGGTDTSTSEGGGSKLRERGVLATRTSE